MIIYGGKASKIANFAIQNTTCDHCQEKSQQDLSVFGRYAHVFFIPLFPLGKKAVAECANCKRTIPHKEFSPALKQKYKDIKGDAKRPIYHWFGLGVLTLLFLSGLISAMTSEKDPRSDLLKADLAAMTSTPDAERDSISYKIKQVFDNFATEDINPSSFEYLTKIEEDKALVLVKIPKLRKVAKEARGEALDMVQMITDNQEDLKGKDVYIGIQGLATMILIKTPSYEDNSRIALQSELYKFYGEKPEPVE